MKIQGQHLKVKLILVAPYDEQKEEKITKMDYTGCELAELFGYKKKPQKFLWSGDMNYIVHT